MSANGVVGVFGELGLGAREFSYPRAITVHTDGRVAVVDKSARIQVFDMEGIRLGGWSMPERVAGKPVGMSFAPDGRLFVADTHYHRVIAFDETGAEVMRFGREGEGPGEFLLPTDVAFDGQGRIYVAEYGGNDRITRWSADGKFECVLIAGEVGGIAMRRPAAMVIDADQQFWVADACNHRMLCFDLAGELLASWGTMGREAGAMRFPYDLTLTPDGNLLVCEYGNHRLQWFDRNGQSLRTWGGQGRRIGELWAPWGVTVATDGRVLVADALNHRVQILVP